MLFDGNLSRRYRTWLARKLMPQSIIVNENSNEIDTFVRHSILPEPGVGFNQIPAAPPPPYDTVPLLLSQAQHIWVLETVDQSMKEVYTELADITGDTSSANFSAGVSTIHEACVAAAALIIKGASTEDEPFINEQLVREETDCRLQIFYLVKKAAALIAPKSCSRAFAIAISAANVITKVAYEAMAVSLPRKDSLVQVFASRIAVAAHLSISDIGCCMGRGEWPPSDCRKLPYQC